VSGLGLDAEDQSLGSAGVDGPQSGLVAAGGQVAAAVENLVATVGLGAYTAYRASDDFVTALRSSSDRRGLVTAGWAVAAVTRRDGDRLASGARRVVRARAGMTLRSLAKSEMGGSEDWVRLAEANPGVPMVIPAGVEIVIPG